MKPPFNPTRAICFKCRRRKGQSDMVRSFGGKSQSVPLWVCKACIKKMAPR